MTSQFDSNSGDDQVPFAPFSPSDEAAKLDQVARFKELVETHLGGTVRLVGPETLYAGMPILPSNIRQEQMPYWLIYACDANGFNANEENLVAEVAIRSLSTRFNHDEIVMWLSAVDEYIIAQLASRFGLQPRQVARIVISAIEHAGGSPYLALRTIGHIAFTEMEIKAIIVGLAAMGMAQRIVEFLGKQA